jgi:hypothetical protein
MPRNAIKKPLLVEDNPEVARLREMLNAQRLYRTEVTHGVQLGGAEKDLVD